MRFKFKSNFKFELEIQNKPKRQKQKKKKNFLKKAIKWLWQEVLKILLARLVTWIIDLFMNGSFYYINRTIFLFQINVDG